MTMTPRQRSKLLRAWQHFHQAEALARRQLAEVVEDLAGEGISKTEQARELGTSKQNLHLILKRAEG